MFLENKPTDKRSRGWVEIICGSMFSGKTEEMIRRLRRAVIARQKVEVFKPIIDTRFDESNVVSHDENIFNSTPVDSASQILLMVGDDVEVVGIDEAQFFDEHLVSVCNQLAGMGIRVIVAGLDMDYLGQPFGPMPELMAIAEYVDKVHAICVKCGNLAHYSHRIVEGEKIVLLGEKESYEPLCRSCFQRKGPY
jgi:thymidine kinase